MCGRFGSTFTGTDLTDYFDLDEKPSFKVKPNYNTAPSQQIITITHNSPLLAREMKWGFVPSWADPGKSKLKPINARADKIDGGFYRTDFHKRRCIIPATYFIEWKRSTVDGEEVKIPHIIRSSEEIMSFAGLYSIHTDGEGKDHYMCAIITCEPNAFMKKIHDRMPVILHQEDIERYLNDDYEVAKSLLKPYNGKMSSYIVSEKINSPRYNSPDLIEPLKNK